jgi:thymidylate synthase (FAD)
MALDQIKVELVDYMGNDLSTVNSARVSFDKASEWENADSVNILDYEPRLKQSDAKLIKYLADHKHFTPFRHNAIQIRCAAPIFLARQLGKHQAGLSWNEVSRRYVDTPPEFYTPDEWRGRPEGSIKQGSSGVITHCDDCYHGETGEPISFVFDDLLLHSKSVYDSMLEKGVAPEMARMVLPQSMMTTWIWSGNLLAFNHVYKERIAEGAQLEAQHFAKELGVILEQLFPVSFRALKGEL